MQAENNNKKKKKKKKKNTYLKKAAYFHMNWKRKAILRKKHQKMKNGLTQNAKQ